MTTYKNSADMRTAAKVARLALLQLRLGRRYNVKSISPEVAMQMADEIRARTGEQAKARQQDINVDTRDLRNQYTDIDRAWSKWNWRALLDLGLISKDDANFVTEVQALYSW